MTRWRPENTRHRQPITGLGMASRSADPTHQDPRYTSPTDLRRVSHLLTETSELGFRSRLFTTVERPNSKIDFGLSEFIPRREELSKTDG